jgi:glycosyltransferase involved in cell wall biosynthesis
VLVLYFADTRFPIERANGAQTMATCHALAQRGHDVRLIVRPDTAATVRDPFTFYGLRPAPNFAIRTIAAARHPALRRLQFLAAAGAMAARTAGVIFTRDLGLAAFLVRTPFNRRMRLIYESHGIADVVSAEIPKLLGRPDLVPSPAKLRRLARREERVWRRSASYVTITQALLDELSHRFGRRDRTFVVPDGGPDPAAFPAPPANVSQWPTLVGYAGHLYPWKGVDVLIQALAALPEANGLIIGGHPAEQDRERVEALSRSLGLEPRVMFTGQLPPAEVALRLRDASILVLPNTASAISERYTSPLKLFEYLALGRPIVASNLPALREVLTDGETALLVPPGDAGALAAAIRRIATDPVLARRLAANALALAPRFTWSARAARLESALTAAVA